MDCLYLHVPTFTLGIAVGDFLLFKWNGKLEESYFPTLKRDGEWVYIGRFK